MHTILKPYNCDFLWIAFQEPASHARVLFPIRLTRGNVKDSQPGIFAIRMFMQNQTDHFGNIFVRDANQQVGANSVYARC
jgi:hypothetical protein